MKRCQKISTITLSLAAAVVALFLFVFFFAPKAVVSSDSTSFHASTEIDPSNFPTDHWTDYAIQPATGTGTVDDPYIIASGEEFAWFAVSSSNASGKYLELGADIDLSAHLWKPAYGGFADFNGKGHAILGMIIYETTGDNIGLFQNSGGFFGSFIGNFKLVNAIVYVDYNNYTGWSTIGFIYGNSSAYFYDISIQDSNIFARGARGRQRVGSFAGNVSNGIGIDGCSIINVSISVVDSGSGTGYGPRCYVGGVFGECSLKNFGRLQIIDKLNIYLDLPRLNASYGGQCWMSPVVASENDSGWNMFVITDFDYTLSNNTKAEYVVVSNDVNYVGKYNLTLVPEDFDRNAWSDVDSASEFPYIFCRNKWFIEYYNLTPNFEEVEFWADYAEEPQKIEGEYLINSAEELAWLINNVKNEASLKISILNDIDLAGKYWTPITLFRNVTSVKINGNGHSLKNMTFDVGRERCFNYGASAKVSFLVSGETSYISNVNISSLVFDGTKFFGKTDVIGLTASTVCGVNGNTTVNNIVVKNLTADLTGHNVTMEYAYLCEDGAVLDADIKILSSAAGESKIIAYQSRSQNNFKGTVITGNFEIEGTGDNDKIVFASYGDSYSYENQAYVSLDNLLSVNAKILKNGAPSGEIFVFQRKNFRCMTGNSSFVAGKVHDNANKDLTDINEEFALGDWSLSNENQQWPYIFLRNEYFMQRYDLTFSSPEGFLWGESQMKPEGSGTNENPYRITSAEELAYIDNYFNLSKDTYISIENDINLSGKLWKPLGSTDTNIEASEGRIFIRGNNHTISNMHAEYPAIAGCDECVGFIGCSAVALSIKDLTFKDAVLKGMFVSTVVSAVKSEDSSFENINVLNVDIEAEGYGAGIMSGGNRDIYYNYQQNTFKDCFVSGYIFVKGVLDVSGMMRTFQIYGIGFSGEFYNCVNMAYLHNECEYQENGYGVGIAGKAKTCVNCINYGNINCQSYGRGIASSLTPYGIIYNCANYGDIVAGYQACGIVGEVSDYEQNTHLQISNCSNYGKLVAQYSANGIAAAVNNTTISQCYNEGSLCATYTSGIAFSIDSLSAIYFCMNKSDMTSYPTAVNSGAGGAGGICVRLDGGLIDGCKVIADINLDVVYEYSGGADIGGIVGEVSTSKLIQISNCYFDGLITCYKACSIGGIVGECNLSGEASKLDIRNCYINAKIEAEINSKLQYNDHPGIGGLVGNLSYYGSDKYCLIVKDCALYGEIISTFIDKQPLFCLYENSKDVNVVYTSFYYNLSMKDSKENGGELLKHYILGSDETEETAFSSDNWLLNETLEISSMPVPRELFWVSDSLENTQNILEFLKASGFTAAA